MPPLGPLTVALSNTNAIPWDMASLPSVSSEKPSLLSSQSCWLLTLVLCFPAPNSDISSTWPLAPSTHCPGSPHSLVSLFIPCALAHRSVTLSTSLAMSHVILGFMVMAGKPTPLHPPNMCGTRCCHTCMCGAEHGTITVTSMPRCTVSAGVQDGDLDCGGPDVIHLGGGEKGGS